MALTEARQAAGAPRGARTPLWRDLGGRTGYRVFGALILDELCQGTDLTIAQLLRALRKELGRSLSRQSMAAWRRGDQATPNEVLLAIHALVRRPLAEASLAVAMRVIGDPQADPVFAEKLRMYYRSGKPELPPERPSWLGGPMGQSKRRRRSDHLVGHTPLWHDLRGKTGYRVFGALILDELCQESALNAEEIRRHLRKELRRPMSRQSLAAWRRGDQAVPNDVLTATAAIVHRTLAEANVVVTMRVLSDPGADPGFAELLRDYYRPPTGGAAIGAGRQL